MVPNHVAPLVQRKEAGSASMQDVDLPRSLKRRLNSEDMRHVRVGSWNGADSVHAAPGAMRYEAKNFDCILVSWRQTCHS